MGRYVIKLPDIGEGMAEAEIVAWHVAPGQVIREEDPLVDVMTDKATVEMPAPVAGTVVAIHGEPGERRPVGSELVVLDVLGEGNAADAAAADLPPRGTASRGPPLTPTLSPQAGRGSEADARVERRRHRTKRSGCKSPLPARGEREGPAPQAWEGEGQAPPVTATPIPTAAPSGAQSRSPRRRCGGAPGISASNCNSCPAPVRAAASRRRTSTPMSRPAPAQRLRPPPCADSARRDGVEEVPVIGLRRAIAEHLQKSKRQIPHFSYVEEVDVTALEELRGALNETYPEREHLTLLPFLIRALVTAAAAHPQVNARYDDEAGVLHRHAAVHVGIATQTEAGCWSR